MTGSDGDRVLLVGPEGWRSCISEPLTGPLEEVSDVAAAEATVTDGPVRCVVGAGSLPDGDGADLAATLGARAPVVVCPTDGDEALAAAALDAGAVDYVPASEAGVPAERLRRAVERAGETATVGRRARQFESLASNPATCLWVLDPDGTVRRANEAARGLLGRETDESVVGRPLWTAPWLAGAPAATERVMTAVETAAAGEPARVEAETSDGDELLRLDLAVRPVESDGTVEGDDAVEAVIVEGVDVTERARLEADLRRSEELHRVTLNNMTDTVLITDDDGRFTYVCPNVHFIFGYTAEEIRDLGTIDELLGEDLYDRAALEDAGVLTNVECTVEDQAGEEHTLLVNVRSVSIQGGTTLYSCRDVTKRKQRERALTTLQGTTRDLQYAESGAEIAELVVRDGTDVLPVDAVAVYLFDDEVGVLRPTAAAPSLERHCGPLQPIGATDETLGRAFTDEEIRSLDREALRSSFGPTVDLAEGYAVPVGAHGVLFVGSRETGVDDIGRELADLLAATAEAALDRVEREGELRDRDRELQQRTRALSQLNEVNELIREIDRIIVSADSRAEIEAAVCERLTGPDRFGFAWVGRRDSTGTVRPQAWSGEGDGYLDDVDLADSGTEPTLSTVRSNEPTLVERIATEIQSESWRSAAVARGFRSALSVPLHHDGHPYGTLTVYAETAEAFDDTVRGVFEEFGETIGAAFAAINQRRALLSDRVTELRYEVTDSDDPFLRLSRAVGRPLRLDGGLQQEPGETLATVDVEGATAEEIREAVGEMVAVDDVRVLRSDGDTVTVRLTLAGDPLVTALAEHGASLRELTADESRVRLVLDVPPTVDAHDIDDIVTARREATLISQRDRQRPSPRAESARERVVDSMTDRQWEVFRTAYRGGFFESPRDHSGEEIAEMLDIAPATFYQLNRTAQRKLAEAVVESR